MSNVVIGDILPYTQATAILNQTVFGTNWTADTESDVVVYVTPVGNEPDDLLQILSYPSQYSVSFIGGLQQVQVTLVAPSAAGNIVTITRQTPAERLNLYSNTNFVPSMLNNDFGILTLVDQQAQLVDQKVGPRYNYSAIIIDVVDTILPVLAANQLWVKNANNDAIIAVDFPSSGVAPETATYLLLTSDLLNLPNSLGLDTVSDGIIINDTGGNTVISRSVTGTTNQIDVTNGNGIAGNINVKISDNVVLPGTAGMGIPEGTTAQRVIPVTGIGLRYNTDLNELEYFDGLIWIAINDSTNIGIVNPGLINQLAYYAANGSTVSGLTTANLGVLVTDATGIPSISAGGQIPGTTTNNVANVGNVGEHISSTVLIGSAVGASTGSIVTVTSIVLSPGDWDVWGTVWSSQSNTATQCAGGITPAASTLPTVPADDVSFAEITTTVPVFSDSVLSLSACIVPTAAPITYYLTARAFFPSGTVAFYGNIHARRRR